MKKLWLLLAVPLILGCIGGGDEVDFSYVGECLPEVQDGLDVNNFYPDLFDVYSGEDLTLTMELENYGSSEATKIEAELFNLGGFDVEGNTVVRVGDLEIPEADMPPVTDEADWDIEAPDFTAATTREIEIGGALSYDYSSIGHAHAVFIPAEEWRNMRADGDTVIDVEQDCSNGPIAVSVQPLRQPMTDGREFTVRVVLTNIGGGKTKSEAHDPQLDWIDTVTLTIPDELELGSTCEDFPTVNGNDIESGPIKLVQGMEKTLSCKMKLKTSTQMVRQAKYKIQAKADYRYTVEDTALVQVTEEAHSLTTSIKGIPKVLGGDTDSVWETGETYEVTLDPRYDGALNPTAFADIGYWSSSIKNDLTVAAKMTLLEAEVDGTNVRLEFEYPADLDTKYKQEPVTLTIKLNYLGRRSTARVEDINLGD